jgi:spermidine synthase
MTSIGHQRSTPLLVLFFLSGVSALIYQVVWIRMLGLVFGVTAFAIATVLASFMAGLAFGNYHFGKRADRHAHPLRLYALLEAGIGLYGLCFPLVLGLVKIIYVSLEGRFHCGFATITAVRFLLSFAILFLPTALMGGTLPVVIKHLVRKRAAVGSSTGYLYSANNLGAVAGCLAAGFLLIMLLGVRGTLYAAAAINILVALTAWILAGSPDTDAVAIHQEPDVAPGTGQAVPRWTIHLALWLFAVEGFVALAYEVVWIRILSASVLVNSVYSFSIVTASFILGLSLGAFAAARTIDKRNDLLTLFAGVEIGIGFCSVLLLVLFSGLPAIQQASGSSAPGGFWVRNVAAEFSLAFLVLLAPCTLMGMLFPLVTKLYTVSIDSVGRRVGIVGGLNTVGSIAGSLAGGFVLIPALGMYRSILVLAAANIVLGVVPLVVNPLTSLRRRVWVGVLTIAVFGGLMVSIPHGAAYWRNMSLSGSGNRLVYYREDHAATVSVIEGETDEGRVKLLDVDGIPVAGTEYMLRTTQKCQAHIPLLLFEAMNRRTARNVLIVGLGSGGTSWSASLHGGGTITCVELVPGVVRAAAAQFKDENHGVFDNPRYRLTIGDGRNYLLATTGRYDAILTESVHPIYAGNASLYSRDYFASCREKLTDSGVVSLWLPIYRISSTDFRCVLRTFQSVFPHCSVWFTTNSLSRQVLVIGTMAPMAIDLPVWRSGARSAAVRGDLGQLGLDDPDKLLSFLLMSEDDISEFAGRAPLHTDDRPLLEFSAPRSRSDLETWKQNLASIAVYKRSVAAYCVGRTSESDSILSRYASADRVVLTGMVDHLDNQEAAIRAYRRAMEVNPGDGTIAHLVSGAQERLFSPLLLQARRYQQTGEPGNAGAIYARIHAIDPQRLDVVRQLAMCRSGSGQVDSACALIHEVLSAHPSWAEGHLTLGIVYVRNRMFEEALRALDTALSMDPGLSEAYSTRAIAEAGEGLYSKALDDLDRAIALAPEEPVPYENRAFVYARMGREDLAAQDRQRSGVLRANHAARR